MLLNLTSFHTDSCVMAELAKIMIRDCKYDVSIKINSCDFGFRNLLESLSFVL